MLLSSYSLHSFELWAWALAVIKFEQSSGSVFLLFFSSLNHLLTFRPYSIPSALASPICSLLSFALCCTSEGDERLSYRKVISVRISSEGSSSCRVSAVVFAVTFWHIKEAALSMGWELQDVTWDLLDTRIRSAASPSDLLPRRSVCVYL